MIEHRWNAEGVQVPLDLAGFRVHQGPFKPVGVFGVALAAGTVGDPDAARVRIERLRAVAFGEVHGRPFVGFFGGQALRVAAMADDAAAGITVIGGDLFQLRLHFAAFLADILDTLVAGKTTLFFGLRRRDLFRYSRVSRRRAG